MDAVPVASADGPSLADPLQTKRTQWLVSTTEPASAIAISRATYTTLNRARKSTNRPVCCAPMLLRCLQDAMLCAGTRHAVAQLIFERAVALRRRMYFSSNYCDSACNCLRVWALEFMTRHYYAWLLSCFAIVALLAACGQASPTADTTQPQIATTAPQITTQPANQTVSVGQSATFRWWRRVALPCSTNGGGVMPPSRGQLKRATRLRRPSAW